MAIKWQVQRRRLRRRDEAGYAAILVALLGSVLFLGMSAMSVDTARWYVEVEHVQKTADAAALAGVTYMPYDLASARSVALASASKNGYDDALATVVVTVEQGSKPSELKVTVSSRIKNTFGAGLGVPTAWITRSAVADYTAPAPMGSPCNTFGNEPPSQAAPAAQPAGSALPATPFPNCSSQPYFWAGIEGPATDKVQGDRFMNSACSTTNAITGLGTYNCSGGKNSEYRPNGYFWAVHVEPLGLGTPITVQIYDPDFMNTGTDCGSLYPAGTTGLADNMNDYTTTDGTKRYSSDVSNSIYCPGDNNPNGSVSAAPTTSFALLHQNDTANPGEAVAIDPDSCIKQFVGQTSVPTISELSKLTTSGHTTSNNSGYNPQKAQLFHQWVPLCTFTPDAPGDYYVQVRTNVSTTHGTSVLNKNAAGTTKTSLIFTGNRDVVSNSTSGLVTNTSGSNGFSMRAVPTDPAKKSYIAVAGNESMPIFQNKKTSTATFNLIRALPGTRGQYISFDFFDPGDGAVAPETAWVQIFPPTDATGSVKTGSGGTPPGCKHARDNDAYVAATDCKVTFNGGSHNGQLEHIVIPIPSDYACGHTPLVLGDCWFSVQITFPKSVTDFTTWTANIGGDPVRLIQ
jgi:Flp pilus assembly protein TadG